MTALASIINWYKKNKRDLPWRNTQNPYHIWLSEVILQQTRVEQGLPYYQKFTDKYPTVVDLALANDDEVMKLWQGLGYYNRAANMLKTARIIHQELKGEFPDTYAELIKLKGIGPYTAAAIASFAFNEPVSVVDGNVYRVLSRVFAIDTPIDSTQGKKIFSELAQEVLFVKDPATHNQAIMELGATVCKPKLAQCENCVLRLQCMAYKNNEVYQYPVKSPKRKPVDRFLNYIFIQDKLGNTYLRQRNNEGIWNNLFEFPLIETEQPVLHADELLAHPQLGEKFVTAPTELTVAFQTKHQLSHQTLYATFWIAGGKNSKLHSGQGFVKVPVTNIHDFAVPRLLERFINSILP
jgi:A/G-specific adenine glycosylase